LDLNNKKRGVKQKISLDEGIRRALSFAKTRLISGIKPEKYDDYIIAIRPR